MYPLGWLCALQDRRKGLRWRYFGRDHVGDQTFEVRGRGLHRSGEWGLFEAGFALGLGLIVIPTCRRNDVGKLHFDIKHLNTLLWASPKELADGLAKRIRAVVGGGPHLVQP